MYSDSASVYDYKQMFEIIYNKYSSSFTNWMEVPEIRVLKKMYSQIKKTLISEKTGDFDQKKDTSRDASPTRQRSTTTKRAPKLDIIQTLNIPLEEIYNRTIKKVTINRFRWSAQSKCTEQNAHTVLVPTENACVCFPSEGDSDESGNVGNLYFVILNSDKTDKIENGVIYRDHQNSYILRCNIVISPYDMCYGGGEYCIPHYTKPIRLKVGSHFYNRCHKPVIIPNCGLWNPRERGYDSFEIDVTVGNDTTIARKALFQSLYKQQPTQNNDMQAIQFVLV